MKTIETNPMTYKHLQDVLKNHGIYLPYARISCGQIQPTNFYNADTCVRLGYIDFCTDMNNLIVEIDLDDLTCSQDRLESIIKYASETALFPDDLMEIY